MKQLLLLLLLLLLPVVHAGFEASPETFVKTVTSSGSYTGITGAYVSINTTWKLSSITALSNQISSFGDTHAQILDDGGRVQCEASWSGASTVIWSDFNCTVFQAAGNYYIGTYKGSDRRYELDGLVSYPYESTYQKIINSFSPDANNGNFTTNLQGIQNWTIEFEEASSPYFDNTTWIVDSAYLNSTEWRNGYSNYVYTKDNTPTITVNIAVASNVSITTSNLNYTAAVGADAGAKCATTDTTTHTCTLPASLELVNGEQCIYMAIAGTTDATSTSGCLSINYNPCKIISGEDNEIPCDCTITDSTTGGFDLTLTGSGQAIAEKDLMVSSLYMPNSCSIAFYTNTSLRAGD